MTGSAFVPALDDGLVPAQIMGTFGRQVDQLLLGAGLLAVVEDLAGTHCPSRRIELQCLNDRPRKRGSVRRRSTPPEEGAMALQEQLDAMREMSRTRIPPEARAVMER